jgi:phosphoglycolate phosphatase
VGYELIIFDWDGTLMDSTAVISGAIRASAADVGLPVPSESDARYVIGLGIDDSLRHLFPSINGDTLTVFAERYRHHFRANEHAAPLFEGVRGMLDDLNEVGHLLAVATGKSRRGLARAFETTGIGNAFVTSRCADEGFPKPHPDMVERILDMTGIERERALMVGDTTHDLQLAANAGIDAVAVTYGAHPPHALAPHAPQYTAHTVAELAAWLLAPNAA